MSNSFGSCSEEAADSELGVAEDKADGGICAKAFAASVQACVPEKQKAYARRQR
jgi:hypothetical protein